MGGCTPVGDRVLRASCEDSPRVWGRTAATTGQEYNNNHPFEIVAAYWWL